MVNVPSSKKVLRGGFLGGEKKKKSVSHPEKKISHKRKRGGKKKTLLKTKKAGKKGGGVGKFREGPIPHFARGWLQVQGEKKKEDDLEERGKGEKEKAGISCRTFGFQGKRKKAPTLISRKEGGEKEPPALIVPEGGRGGVILEHLLSKKKATSNLTKKKGRGATRILEGVEGKRQTRISAKGSFPLTGG